MGKLDVTNIDLGQQEYNEISDAHIKVQPFSPLLAKLPVASLVSDIPLSVA